MNFTKNIFFIFGLSFLGLHYVNAMEESNKKTITIAYNDAIKSRSFSSEGGFITFIDNKVTKKVSFNFFNDKKNIEIYNINSEATPISLRVSENNGMRHLLMEENMIEPYFSKARQYYQELSSVIQEEIFKDFAGYQLVRYFINDIKKEITISAEK